MTSAKNHATGLAFGKQLPKSTSCETNGGWRTCVLMIYVDVIFLIENGQRMGEWEGEKAVLVLSSSDRPWIEVGWG